MTVLNTILNPQDTTVGIVTFDATVSESTDQRVTIVDVPVEDGSTRQDNAILERAVVTIDGIVGNVPFASDPIPSSSIGSRRADDAYDALSSFLASFRLFELRTYNRLPARLVAAQWIITSLRRNDAPETADGLSVTVTCEEWQVARTEGIVNPVDAQLDFTSDTPNLGSGGTQQVQL